MYSVIILNEYQGQVWAGPQLYNDIGEAAQVGLDHLATLIYTSGWPMEVEVLEGWYGQGVTQRLVTQEEAKEITLQSIEKANSEALRNVIDETETECHHESVNFAQGLITPEDYANICTGNWNMAIIKIGNILQG